MKKFLMAAAASAAILMSGTAAMAEAVKLQLKWVTQAQFAGYYVAAAKGYYKDEAKSAQTFRTFEGVRWSVPGDWAEVNDDGTLVLLGRGSVCINTGGEKVFPEEVEEALKRHPSVRDAVAVGIPNPRFGETICAVVEPAEGATPELAELAEFVKEHLAHYKAPRHLVVVDTIGRAPNGKVDYKRLKGVAMDQLTQI